MQAEQQLLEEYVNARTQVDEYTSKLKAAKDVLDKAEAALVADMETRGATSTAKYETLGRLSVLPPSLYVSVSEGRFDEAFAYLRSIGEAEAIRETVHHKTLSAIMKGRFDKNEPVPECFTCFFKPQCRYEKP